MHDIGKIGVPEGILNKPGALTAEELAIMRDHARQSYEIVKLSSF
ncbi:HD domain-containing protein [Paradesulfitobacterium aromaticivorans]